MPGRRRKMSKEERQAQSMRILAAWTAGATIEQLWAKEGIGRRTICNIIGHYVRDKREELTRPWAKAFIVDQCFDVVAKMQTKLKSGDAYAAGAIIKAAERYAKATGADEPQRQAVAGDPENPLTLVGRLTWQPPTET